MEEKIDAKIHEVRMSVLYSNEYVHWLNALCLYANTHDFDRTLASRLLKSIQIERGGKALLMVEHKIWHGRN